MRENLEKQLNYFKQIPFYIEQTSMFVINNKQDNDIIDEKTGKIEQVIKDLSEQKKYFVSNYKDKLPKILYDNIIREINDATELLDKIVFIVYKSSYHKNINELNELNDVINQVQNKQTLKSLSKLKVKSILNQYDQQKNNQNIRNNTALQTSNQNQFTNNGPMQQATRQSQPMNNNINNQSRIMPNIPRPKSLEQKVREVGYRKGQDYSYNVTKVAVEHELGVIRNQINQLQSIPIQNRNQRQQRQLNSLIGQYNSLLNYITTYKSNYSSKSRENKINKYQNKIENLYKEIIEKSNNQKMSFLGRKRQKRDIEKLTKRIAVLQQKRGAIMGKQLNITMAKFNKRVNTSRFQNNVDSFITTTTNEISNIRSDIRARFSSSRKNNTLNQKCMQLQQMQGICESTYSYNQNIQSRNL